MDCGVQSAMLSVPEPPAPPTTQQQPQNAVFAPPDTDQAQFEADKRAVYKYLINYLNIQNCNLMYVCVCFFSLISDTLYSHY